MKLNFHLQNKGSVLVFALIVLSLLLVASLSIATVTISGTKSATVLNRSTVAFQIADSGVEEVLEQIYNTSCNSSPLSCLGSCSVVDSKAGVTGSINGGAYRVTFFEADGDPISSCSVVGWRSTLNSIQSEGTYGNTTRAVKADIKPL